MKSIGRAAALVAVLGMPVIAYVLARASVSVWEGMGPASSADASVALEDGLVLLAAAAGAAIAAYLALTGYAMLLGAAWRGGRAIPKALTAMAPHGWTRVTATALGLTMSAGLAGPAFAAEGGSMPFPSPGWVDPPVAVAAEPSALDVAGWVQAPASEAVDTDGDADAPAPARTAAPSATSLTVGWVEADAPSAPAHASPSEPQLTSTLHDVPALDTTDLATAETDKAVVNTDVVNSAGSDTAVFGPAESNSPQVASAQSQAPPPSANAYVVQSGDSLWRITEALLGADASSVKVAAAWPALYEANLDSIGDNPSLIHPGLTLTIPAGLGA